MQLAEDRRSAQGDRLSENMINRRRILRIYPAGRRPPAGRCLTHMDGSTGSRHRNIPAEVYGHVFTARKGEPPGQEDPPVKDENNGQTVHLKVSLIPDSCVFQNLIFWGCLSCSTGGCAQASRNKGWLGGITPIRSKMILQTSSQTVWNTDRNITSV